MRIGRLVFALLLALSVAPAAWAEEPSPADDVEAIRALVQNLEAANNAGDVTRWVGYFSPDAVYMPPGSPAVTTREGLIDVAEAGFRHDADIDIEPVEIRVAGDWAFARNRVTGAITLHDSREVVQVDVKQLVIYELDGQGAWRIARMISNSNTP